MSNTAVGFSTHSGTAVPMDQANVDTDQIIPKQFLTSVSRSGFGKNLFFDWRYLNGDDTKPNPNFVLNDPQYQGASILLARENFGCGSSREHAPWALGNYGFHVIIATSFADIFFGNCINNQMLPVQLSSDEMDTIFAAVCADAKVQIEVDLPNQQVKVLDNVFSFTIPEAQKFTLTSGLDSIGQTLLHEDAISAFEAKRSHWQ